ncbi:hypothetical protein HHI36_022263 [Cryptolaemus montrouzieri]|uniref:Uncharacterized protein n=1 Tax=Cryptolaemus montrouzieri TaxID=559131 RepID=A0ABD2MZC9_9CUCU
MSPIIKCYQLKLETHYQNISSINTGLGKTMNNSTAFRQYYKDKYEGWNQIYTDASKKGSEGPVGIGICTPKIGWTLSEKLPSYIFICTAERGYIESYNHYRLKIRKYTGKMWIPSHMNIEDNEIERDLWKEWKEEWDRITLTKGK